MRTQSKARENTGDQVLVCFIFAFDWLKEWPEFSGPIKEQRKAETNQSRVTFDTQLKFALYDYRFWSLKTWVRVYSPEKNWLRWKFVAFRWPEQKSVQCGVVCYFYVWSRFLYSAQVDSSTSLLVCFVLFWIVLCCFLRLTANDTTAKLTDQFSQIRLICSTDKRFAWNWWWLPQRLLKHQSFTTYNSPLARKLDFTIIFSSLVYPLSAS